MGAFDVLVCVLYVGRNRATGQLFFPGALLITLKNHQTPKLKAVSHIGL
jgi:hypothetical protein